MSAQTGNGLGHMADVASYSATHPAIAALLTAGGDTAESWTVQRMIIFYHWRSTVEQ